MFSHSLLYCIGRRSIVDLIAALIKPVLKASKLPYRCRSFFLPDSYQHIRISSTFLDCFTYLIDESIRLSRFLCIQLFVYLASCIWSLVSNFVYSTLCVQLYCLQQYHLLSDVSDFEFLTSCFQPCVSDLVSPALCLRLCVSNLVYPTLCIQLSYPLHLRPLYISDFFKFSDCF